MPHTHWDREWYKPFQEFRFRLVELIDGLLPLLEHEGALPHFMLDGQMAVVDDYLAMRPAAEERLASLVTSGRLSIGPWYILMDEFLVSGETIVRDLQLGMERAADLGGAMQIGYLPDMFGHIAQMPQILRSAGIDRAVVWRGVPRSVDRARFAWSSPDGSTVLAEYLVHGYGNGAHLPPDGPGAVRMISAYISDIAPFIDRSRSTEGILLMNGTDHQVPRAWLADVVDQVNALQEDVKLTVCGLGEALDAVVPGGLADAPPDLPSHVGELRSSARANLLMGVASNRVDVKQAAARAERGLERRAEPAAALFGSASSWPAPFLDEAWKLMVLNAAHDSVCACSVDEVVDAVLHRYAEARQIADAITRATLGRLAASLSCSGAVAVNLSPRQRSGIVELVLPGTELPDGCQLLVSSPEVLFDDELSATIENNPELPSGTVPSHPPTCRVLALSGEVPGYGWTRWRPAPPSNPVAVTNGFGMTNGLVTIEVDPVTGTFSLDGIAGFDHLVDSGDHGDTYNYSPPTHDTVIDRPEDVTTRLVESGPIRGVIEVTRIFRWPTHIAADARAGSRAVEVVSRLTLCAGEALVRIETSFENACDDHRLRSLFPLGTPASSSRAECAFAVVERPLVAEGGPTERGLATYPSRRFVQAGDLTVVHEGLLEYELVDENGSSIAMEPGAATFTASHLALTLLRATGMLSQVEMAYRPLSAGPPIAVKGPQMRGQQSLRYGVVLGPCDPYALVEQFSTPIEVVTGLGLGTVPGSGRALRIEGAEVSSVRRSVRNGGRVEVRVFNPKPSACAVTLEGGDGSPSKGDVVDLCGRTIGSFSGTIDLGPWKIATLLLQ